MARLPEELSPRYRVLRELGQGGFGVVLAAEDRQLGRQVAIKLLHAVGDADFAARFEREARVTASLSHPHVVPVYDYGVAADGTAYILYELVDGPSLAARVAADPPTPEGVVRWGVQLAEALQVAHEAGVVHRDVKPGNVLLRGDGQAVLCDFGIAHRPHGHTVVTEAGIRLGTPGYMAPEAILEGATTPAADQFALASTLLELLTGRTAYGGGELEDVIRAARSREPLGGPALERLAPGLRQVLARALARDPASRYPDLGALARALAAADLHGAPLAKELPRLGPPGSGRSGPVARPGGSGRTTTRKRLRPDGGSPSRRVVRRAGVGWTVLVLAAGVAYGLLQAPPPEPAPPEPPATTPDESPEREALASALDAAIEALAAPHRAPGASPEDPLPVGAPEHSRALWGELTTPGFARRLRDLERTLLDWDAAAREQEPALRRGRMEAVVRDLLPHLAEDLTGLHDSAWGAVMGGDLRLRGDEHLVVEHLNLVQEASSRLVRHLGHGGEAGPRWRLELAVQLAARNGVEGPLLDELARLLRDRLGREAPGVALWHRAMVPLALAGRALMSRGIWDCEVARAWQEDLATQMVEQGRAPAGGARAHEAYREVIGLVNALAAPCAGPEGDRALVELRPMLQALEDQVDLYPAEALELRKLANELRGLRVRNQLGADKIGHDWTPAAAALLRDAFWLELKLRALGRQPVHEVVPRAPQARAEWVRARIPARDADPAARQAGVLAAYRGLRVMRGMPWSLMQALAELASVTPFPGRTYLAGRLRLRSMGTESAAERAPMLAALDRLTRGYAPREEWGCEMLQGEMWGNLHAEQAVRDNIAPELNFFASTDTLSPFLAGAGAAGTLMLRDCRGHFSEEDEARALRFLQDGVRGRERGARLAATTICRATAFPGPRWEPLRAADHPVHALMQELCR